MTDNRAKIFWTGRSQAVRLPKEFRFDAEEVAVRREGNAVILEPLNEWPEGWVDSFTSPDVKFERSPQGRQERRRVAR
jgi:antitoxin VapB